MVWDNNSSVIVLLSRADDEVRVEDNSSVIVFLSRADNEVRVEDGVGQQ
jgi:hypothetical protein